MTTNEIATAVWIAGSAFMVLIPTGPDRPWNYALDARTGSETRLRR